MRVGSHDVGSGSHVTVASAIGQRWGPAPERERVPRTMRLAAGGRGIRPVTRSETMNAVASCTGPHHPCQHGRVPASHCSLRHELLAQAIDLPVLTLDDVLAQETQNATIAAAGVVHVVTAFVESRLKAIVPRLRFFAIQ